MKKIHLTLLAGAGLLIVGLLAWGPSWWSERSDRRSPVPRVVSTAPGFPLWIELASGTRLELPEPPTRILPGNAATVDFVSALIAPERVAALPEAAVGYSRLDELDERWRALPRFHGYSAEIVLALEPDLVLVHNWQSPETTALLLDSGLPVLVSPLPKRWAEITEVLRFLGRVLGVEARAEEVVSDLERRRAALRRARRGGPELRALSYSNLGTGGTAAGAGTTADVLFELAGLRNAAAEAGLTGHVSVDHERLLAFAPDLIVVGTLAEGEGPAPSKAYLLAQPELAALPAVAERRIVALPPRLFTTTSQELLRAAERLSAEVDRLFAE